MATTIGLSHWHAQRTVTRLLGETLTQRRSRLRIEVAAAMLVTTELRILDIAVAVGFSSHEAFTRAFSRHLGITPARYRRESRVEQSDVDHVRLVRAVGPCIRLMGTATVQPDRRTDATQRKDTMTYSISHRTLTATPTLHQTRRIGHDDIAATLGEILPAVYGYVIASGTPMAGVPYVRYLDRSPAFTTIEAGIPLATAADGDDEVGIVAGELPAGPAAVTIHTGPYDQLVDGHIALDRWMNEQGVSPSGPAWESYLTDPTDVPDPADWQTEIVWPLAETSS